MNQHYLNRYEKLIAFCKTQSYQVSVEKHHIIPKCFGGSNKKENIVSVPPRIHFILHKLLHKAYPENRGLMLAYVKMTNKSTKNHSRFYRINSREYEITKKLKSDDMKVNNPMNNLESRNKLRGENNPAKSIESREKISKSLKGRNSPTLGMKWTEETRLKMSE